MTLSVQTTGTVIIDRQAYQNSAKASFQPNEDRRFHINEKSHLIIATLVRSKDIYFVKRTNDGSKGFKIQSLDVYPTMENCSVKYVDILKVR